MLRTLLTTLLLSAAATAGLWKSTCTADLSWKNFVDTPRVVGASAAKNAQTPQSLPAPKASPRYYAVIYTYQDAENQVLKSHTFATFVKAVNGDVAADATAQDLETHDISWLPAKFSETLKLSFFPTAGKNYTVAETLGFAHRLGADVRRHDPIEIDAELYEAAVLQAKLLSDGSVRYKLYDSSKRGILRAKGNVLHCIDAIGNIAGEMHSGSVRGHASSERLVEHFRSHLKSEHAPTWLASMVR
ncbi:MAG: hypothetical protein QM775_23585 [Pirellulales bacterium]